MEKPARRSLQPLPNRAIAYAATVAIAPRALAQSLVQLLAKPYLPLRDNQRRGKPENLRASGHINELVEIFAQLQRFVSLLYLMAQNCCENASVN